MHSVDQTKKKERPSATIHAQIMHLPYPNTGVMQPHSLNKVLCSHLSSHVDATVDALLQGVLQRPRGLCAGGQPILIPSFLDNHLDLFMLCLVMSIHPSSLQLIHPPFIVNRCGEAMHTCQSGRQKAKKEKGTDIPTAFGNTYAGALFRTWLRFTTRLPFLCQF